MCDEMHNLGVIRTYQVEKFIFKQNPLLNEMTFIKTQISIVILPWTLFHDTQATVSLWALVVHGVDRFQIFKIIVKD